MTESRPTVAWGEGKKGVMEDNTKRQEGTWREMTGICTILFGWCFHRHIHQLCLNEAEKLKSNCYNTDNRLCKI